MFASDFSEKGNFSIPQAEIMDFEQISVNFHNIFACFAFSLSTTQINILVKE